MSSLLTDKVQRALLPAPNGATLFIFVGNTLRGDDGAGPYIFERLSGVGSHIRLMNVGDRPENCIDDAVTAAPAKTVIVDAADFGGIPGEARVIPHEFIPDTTLSTHTFPLKVIAGILQEDTGSEVIFIGIQSKEISWSEQLTPEVKNTADAIAAFLSTNNESRTMNKE